MLKYAYLVANIGADTAENKPHSAEMFTKNWQILAPDTLGARLPLSGAEQRGAASRRRGGAEVATLIFWIFANFWRARSRPYRNEILQPNTHFAAIFKIYKII